MKNIEMLRRTVSLDLDLEHENNHTKNALCNLGPILTKDVVTRIARAQKVTKKLLGHTQLSVNRKISWLLRRPNKDVFSKDMYVQIENGVS